MAATVPPLGLSNKALSASERSSSSNTPELKFDQRIPRRPISHCQVRQRLNAVRLKESFPSRLSGLKLKKSLDTAMK